MEIDLEQDKKYQAVIELGVIEKLAGNEVIAGKLKDAGFKFVQVTGSGSQRNATGVWAKASQRAPLPSQVKKVNKI